MGKRTNAARKSGKGRSRRTGRQREGTESSVFPVVLTANDEDDLQRYPHGVCRADANKLGLFVLIRRAANDPSVGVRDLVRAVSEWRKGELLLEPSPPVR
jgi:hypothetical protein